MLSALALVPPEEVADRFDQLLTILEPWKASKPLDLQERIENVFDSFEINYIGRVRLNTRQAPRVAPIDVWNVRRQTLEGLGRTNNETEGYHLKVGQTLGAQGPNLWKFLRCLQGLEVESRKTMADINSGRMNRKYRTKYIESAKRIQNVARSWNENIDLGQFLRGIAHNFRFGGTTVSSEHD